MNARLIPIAEKAPYVAAGSTGFAILTLNDWAVVTGIVVTILTFFVNWYYKRKGVQALRERMAHDKEISEEDLDALNKL
jgi:hypothetical protein